jgi:predicted ArsR family transcriptional regulator
MPNEQAQKMLRARFERYQALNQQAGEQSALEQMLEQETEREKRQMGPLIQNDTLSGALTKTIPIFEQFGMVIDVVDVSNEGRDAVLEIHKECPYAAPAREFGVERPCKVACELDIKAVMRAFQGVNGRMLASIADGDCICIFKYERPDA